MSDVAVGEACAPSLRRRITLTHAMHVTVENMEQVYIEQDGAFIMLTSNPF